MAEIIQIYVYKPNMMINHKYFITAFVHSGLTESIWMKNHIVL